MGDVSMAPSMVRDGQSPEAVMHLSERLTTRVSASRVLACSRGGS